MTDSNRLSTLTNGLRVLEQLVEGPTTMRRLATAVGLPRQTTYRIVATLIDAGWVGRDGEWYQVSPRLWSLASQSFSFTGLRDAHAATVRRLAAEHGESVHLAVLDHDHVVYIDKADGSNPVGSYTSLGGRAPAHCVATGKLLLAHADPTVVARLVEAGLTSSSPLSIDEPSALTAELERVRRDGYAVNRGEWRLGVGGVAVAVESPFGGVVAALGFSGPSERILARLDDLVWALRDAVRTAPAGAAHEATVVGAVS